MCCILSGAQACMQKYGGVKFRKDRVKIQIWGKPAKALPAKASHELPAKASHELCLYESRTDIAHEKKIAGLSAYQVESSM